MTRKPVDARLGVSWRAILGVETDPPPQNPHNPQKPGRVGDSGDSGDSAQGVRPARKPPRVGSDLDPAELRHRYDERAAVYEYEAGLPRPEAELRAWLDVALDYIEADPERAALPNREARALAARVLAAAGIPEPPAMPLRLGQTPAGYARGVGSRWHGAAKPHNWRVRR